MYYVARDKWGYLMLFRGKPINDDGDWVDTFDQSCETICELDKTDLPEVTYGNSPVKIKLVPVFESETPGKE